MDPVWARRLAKQSEQLHEPYQCDGLGCTKTTVCLEKFNGPGAFTEHLCCECGDKQEVWGQETPSFFSRRRRYDVVTEEHRFLELVNCESELSVTRHGGGLGSAARRPRGASRSGNGSECAWRLVCEAPRRCSGGCSSRECAGAQVGTRRGHVSARGRHCGSSCHGGGGRY